MTLTRRAYADLAAAGATFVCALHCLALPLLAPAIAPLLALSDDLELTTRACLVGFSLLVLGHGAFRRADPWPLALGLLGAGLLLGPSFADEPCCAHEAEDSWVTALTIGSALAFLGAHLLNARRADGGGE